MDSLDNPSLGTYWESDTSDRFLPNNMSVSLTGQTLGVNYME